MKILHLEYDLYPPEAIKKLETIATIERFLCAGQEELYAKLSKDRYEVIFTRLGLMLDEKAIALQPDLQYIVTSTTGLNHIDETAASNKGITVVSLKGETEFLANVKSTAEHTWGLLLSLIRNLPGAITHVKTGGWDRQPFMANELDGKTLGIIGYGRLGKVVARYGAAFGMRVLVHDHNPENYEGHAIEAVTLKNLLNKSDVVVLLISWSRENENFMDAEKFSAMKPGAYFINTARGELVDEKALVDALMQERLKGAAVDVLWNDSSWPGKVNDSTLLLEYFKNHNNVLITPHMGGYGKDSIAKTRTFVTEKLLKQLWK
ncbi:MAG: hypothetical protein KF856_13810 [Cyclobacteriaceae bacterium]|nr:hypothetical protein [Cyclobacteriaceae bacterium]